MPDKPTLRLHDTLTRQTLPVTPADGRTLRFYACGPTVYGPAHIGNFRTFIAQDIFRRVLELSGTPTLHVRNITDVDDKTIRDSIKAGQTLTEFTQHWTRQFHADCAALNLLPPHVEPKATDHIPHQIRMIETLMERGHAYAAPDGSVYFRVTSFADYGKLSHLEDRELRLGAAQGATSSDEYTKDALADFALWKGHKPEDGDNAWDSPWGRGRPGWHIECSAMSKKHLGETIDLHTGGVDLLFPHHENEIAQSECCNGAQFARHWYHSEHLLVNNRKMAKSEGNMFTLDQLVEKGHSPMALRYALLAGHPRKQLNFTLESLHAAESALKTLRAYRASLPNSGGDANVFNAVFSALSDDLNTPGALGALFTVVNRGTAGVDAPAFDRVMFALGLKLDAPAAPRAEAPTAVTALAEKRWAAKQAKDFATADALRKELAAAGWSMLDRKDGYSLEPAKK
jgi:cysteinyl-tRNA synthetase